MYLEKITKKKEAGPSKIVLYGTHGVGKSTLASQWPNPIFLPCEDGVRHLDVAKLPVPKTISDVTGSILELTSPEGLELGYKTLIVDTIDWMVTFIHAKVCEQEKVKSLAKISYNRGAGMVTDGLTYVLRQLDGVRNAGMHVVAICHEYEERINTPSGETIGRYAPFPGRDIKGGSTELCGWADEVYRMAANYQHVKKEVGFGNVKTIREGNGERVVFTSDRPTFTAKTRLGLPSEMSVEELVSFYSEKENANG